MSHEEQPAEVEPSAPEEKAPPADPPSARRAGRSAGLWILVALVGVAAFVVGRSTGGESEKEEAHAGDGETGQAKVWTCSMHPQIQSPEAGQCPICGMDLIPLQGGGSDGPAPDRVRLSERARTLARIETRAVKPFPNQGVELRLLGRLEHDETRMRTVTAWTEGRIDRLKVSVTGEKVKRNQTIAALYSPEIYAAHQDLIESRRQIERLVGSTPIARASAQATSKSARQRLRLLGVSEGALKQMEKASSPWRNVQIQSPFAGTVLEKLVNEGEYVSPGKGIYKLVDLSSLWVQLDAYEQDLPLLSRGQAVSLSFEALPEESFEGRLAFIDPVVNTRTRTARVRVEVANDDGRLKPGMFAEAVVSKDADSGEVPPLVIPDSAPLFSGRRSLVYVEVPGAQEPTYEAREVRLGPRTGGFYPVVAGLEYGERVVTHGAFRLDADLQIRGGRSLMARPDDRSPTAFDKATPLPARDRALLAPVMEAYLDAQEALTADDLDKARLAVKALDEASRAVVLSEKSALDAWSSIRGELQSHGLYLIRAGDLDGARAAFGELTEQIGRMLSIFGNPLERPVSLAFCPMAFGNRGAEWFQRGNEVRNAYFGAQMLQCGEVRDTISGGAFMAERPERRPAAEPSSGPASEPSSSPASGEGGSK